MSALDIILVVFVVLFVVCLIILAASEPRYTWRDIATLDEIIADMELRVAAMGAAIGRAIAPILERLHKSLKEMRSSHD